MQPQIRRLKSSGPAPGHPGMGIPSEAPPSRTSRPPARDFSTDTAQDTVILSVQDLAAPQEAVTQARRDQEGPGPRRGRSGRPGQPGPGERPSRARRPRSGEPSPFRGAARAPGPPACCPPAWRPRDRRPPWPVTAADLAPAVLGQGAAHHRAALGPAPPASPLARAGPVAGPCPAHPGRRAVRRGRDQRRAGPQPRPGPAPPPRRRPGQDRPGARPAAVRAAAAARTAAARWIAGQVSADAIVSCDPQMCAQLQAQGIPPRGSSCSAAVIPPRWAAT